MKYKNILLVVFFLTLFVFQQVQAGATIPSAENPSQIGFAPANTPILFSIIKVYVYPLTDKGETFGNSPVLCAYPYDVEQGTYGCGTMNSNPTDGVQNPDYIDVENYYLKDVIAAEMNVKGIPPELDALKAQAIASRTVASWKTFWSPWIVDQDGVKSINNSTQYQAFIPGAYSLSSSQGVIDSAIQSTQRQYLSDGPDANGLRHTIDAEFGSDMVGRSLYGNQTYLQEIQDPISTACGVGDNGNLWGMSQRGAIRWAKGNVCPDGTGAAWPVKWNHQQILVHYYTGVDIVDDATGGKVAPDDRWNLLNYNLPNTTAIAGTNFTVNVTLQNTSTTDWTTDRFCLSFYARRRISPLGAG